MKTKIYEDLAHFYPLWRETTLEKTGHENREARFITTIFNKYPGTIQSVIDLGGGVGLHADLLQQQGYDVTVLDQSKKALSIAKKTNRHLKIIHSSFEKIDVRKNYDAAICMWSTPSYILSENGRRQFYSWIQKSVRHVVILDEANFYRYSKQFHKIYEGENDEYRLKVTRDWILTPGHLKKTTFVYEMTDKETGKTKIVRDAENEQYLTIEQLQEYFGSEWKLRYLCGDYAISNTYKQKDSKRIITAFFRT